MVKEKELKNGIKVITQNVPSIQSVAIGVWIGVGSRYEHRKVSGISHFLEHLLFKGTKKRSGERLKQLIEGVGGSFNGFTSEEATCYLVKILDKYSTLGLDVLSDMVASPKLAKDDIEKERSVIFEEIKMYKDLPNRYVQELFGELLWPGQPLGRNIAGEMETVSSISQKDLFPFHKDYYRGENIVVSICGNLRKGRIENEIEDCFSRLPAGKKRKFSPILKKEKGGLKVLYKKTEQVHICLGGKAFSYFSEDRFPLSLLSVILGGNMSSRLFREVREKRGLAYEIHSGGEEFYDTGAFTISAGTSPKLAYELTKVIIEEIGKIREKAVHGNELKRAKEFLVGQLILHLEDSETQMLFLGGSKLRKGKIEKPSEIIKKIKKVEKDEIRKVAKELFTNKNLYLALIGPLRNRDKVKTLLKYD